MFSSDFSPQAYFEHSLLLLVTPNDLYWSPELRVEIHAYYSPRDVISTTHLTLMTDEQIEAVEELARGYWFVVKTQTQHRFVNLSTPEALDLHFQKVRTMYRNMTGY